MTRRNDPVKNRAAQKRWASAHPEKVREVNRRKYLARREEILGRQRCRDRQNAERLKAYKAQYRKTPEGKAVYHAAHQKRRALKRGGDVVASTKEVKALLLSATQCAYCMSPFSEQLPPTLDHKTALARGGSHSIVNLTAACSPCNRRKGTRGYEEFVSMISDSV